MNNLRKHLGGGLLAALLLVFAAGVVTALPVPATESPSRLPDTTGPDPWLAMFGLLSLSAGWLVQRRGPKP